MVLVRPLRHAWMVGAGIAPSGVSLWYGVAPSVLVRDRERETQRGERGDVNRLQLEPHAEERTGGPHRCRTSTNQATNKHEVAKERVGREATEPLDGNQEEMQGNLPGCTRKGPEKMDMQNTGHREQGCTLAGQRGGGKKSRT